MGISYRIDPARRRVYVMASGPITGADFFQAQQRLIEDPAFQPTFSQLFDLIDTEEVEVSANQIGALAERTAFVRGARRAIVVNRPLLFGLARMFGLMADATGGDVEIFSDVRSAEQWLDGGLVSPPTLPDDAVQET
jgi:hypothetical protein